MAGDSSSGSNLVALYRVPNKARSCASQREHEKEDAAKTEALMEL